MRRLEAALRSLTVDRGAPAKRASLCAISCVLGAAILFAGAARAAGVGRYFPQDRSFGRFGTEPGEFRVPTGVALARDGTLTVTDYKNNSVLKFDDDGRFISAIAPGEVPFEGPTGLAFDSKKNLYVVEEQGCRVRKYGPKGEPIATYGGQGGEPGRFRGPRGIAINAADHVFVADYGNHRIQEFDANFTYLRTLQFKSVGRRPATPHGLAIDMENKLWACFSNIHRIARFDAEGNADVVLGEEGTGLSQFEEPRYLAFDVSNCFFVSDYRNGRIQRFNAKGEFLFSIGVKGSGHSQFKGPQGIAIDLKGNVYVADSENFRLQCLLINEQLADLNTAQVLFAAKEYEKALPIYQKIVAKVRLHREARQRIVFICEAIADRENEKGEVENAKSYLDEILRIEPSHVKALRYGRYILWKNNKGLIYYLTLGTGIFFTFIFLVTTLVRVLTSEE